MGLDCQFDSVRCSVSPTSLPSADNAYQRELVLPHLHDSMLIWWVLFYTQIQGNITPHAIVILPKTDGMEMLVCYEDEGVYVNTYGRITKDVVLQWGEMPTSVGMSVLPLLLS